MNTKLRNKVSSKVSAKIKGKISARIIEVVKYDPRWQSAFEIEKSALAKVLGNNAVTIDHIGSTAVNGLAAKPIIDILVSVASLNKLDASAQAIESLGYALQGKDGIKGENGIAGRRFFQKGGYCLISHHVHAFQAGDAHLHRHRAFRDYLIAHPLVAFEYGELKKAAAVNCYNNITVYMALKNEFIQKHERLALEWLFNEQTVK